MSIKAFLKSIGHKALKSKPIGKKLAKSYISLFLVLILGISTTFAWFAEHEGATIKSNDLEFQSASSLRINKDKSVSNQIHIDKAILDEASSVDGRNIYFPVGETFNTRTADMFFREGTAGDGITGNESDEIYTDNPEMKGHYIYKDFDLKGTSGNTPVYIKSYRIEISDGDTVHDTDVNGVYQDEMVIEYKNGKPDSQIIPPDYCPIRLAFISDSASKPVVIDPSAQEIDYAENSDAVTLIDDNGVPMTERTAVDSFSSYYYGKHPLFVIPGGQDLPVTLVVWLEGTMGNSDKYIGKEISIDIDIESNFAEMETIRFIDKSEPDNNGGQQYWVGNDEPLIACSYKDPFSEEGRWKTVTMTRASKDTSSADYHVWTAAIPKKAVDNISFYRIARASDRENKNEKHGTIYNAWHTCEDVMDWVNTGISSDWYVDGDLQSSRQMPDVDGNKFNSLEYTAIHGNGYSVTSDSDKRLSPCIGYWNYSGGSGSTTPTQPATESGGGGGGSGNTAQIGVYVNTGNQTWIDTNVTSNNSTLYFKTANGGEYPLSRTANNYFSTSVTLSVGDEITQFSIKDSTNSEYRTWTASPTFKVLSSMTSGGWNVTYSVNKDNNAMTC